MIKIICVGKIKENYYKEAISEYIRRLSKYTKIEIKECNDEDNKNKRIVLELEKQSILKHINPKDYIVTLQIEGETLSSKELATKIDKTLIHNSNIAFIIGGSYGLDDEIKKISNFKLSFSKLTYPHQLFRVILLEQIYRCFKILNNEEYHK